MAAFAGILPASEPITQLGDRLTVSLWSSRPEAGAFSLLSALQSATQPAALANTPTREARHTTSVNLFMQAASASRRKSSRRWRNGPPD
jgi:hypothetical protein